MRNDAVDVVLVVPSSPAGPPVPGESTGTSTPLPSTPYPNFSRLPRTGAEFTAVLLIAVVLLALGALVVRTGRARRACPLS